MTPRIYALNILERVMSEGAYASLSLRAKNQFDEKDNALISELVYGTLRNLSMLEYQWEDLCKRRVKTRVSLLLSMSVYQIQYLDKVPDYAVVNEAVDMASKGDKGFVNAVLHKVIKRGVRHPDIGDEWDILSVENSTPLWMIRLWVAHYGEETTRELLAFNQTRPLVYGRLNTLKASPAAFQTQQGYRFIEDTTFLYDGVIAQTKAFQNGEVLIQDYASQQIVKQLLLRKGNRVLDACSAPGTKAQQIACLLENKGEIVACDIYEERVQLIKQLMEKTGVTIATSKVNDASIPHAFEEESFDRMLLDVPCSGLGDLRHKPEIRWNTEPEDMDTLIHLQRDILDACAPYLKDGGYMVYSTCTLNKKENEKQIQSFLKRHPDYRLLEEKTIFPMEHNSDGFYYAQMQRIL